MPFTGAHKRLDDRDDDLPLWSTGKPALPPHNRKRVYSLIGLLLFVVYYIFVHSETASYHADDAAGADWNKYAYSLYATDTATVCHAVMVMESLEKLGSKAQRVLFYPQQWDTKVTSSKDRDSQLLVIARDKYKAKLHPVKLLDVHGFRSPGMRSPEKPKRTWDKSVTKFFAFSLTQYRRIIALDSDITLLQSLDELFFLPPTPIAMPRAYWSPQEKKALTSLLMVIEPSAAEFFRLQEDIAKGGDPDTVEDGIYDMELLNDRFGNSALVLPQRPYALLTGEFRSSKHNSYLGLTSTDWNAADVLKEAKLVHFSDWPLPKPWIMWPREGLLEMQPACEGNASNDECAERKIWKGLYEDFRQRRKNTCALLSVEAPDWYDLVGKDRDTSSDD